ncbi:MAG: Lrp/AsnC family transcriptional regulator [Conexivisphaerales archaeon]|nr:Lrp/AsnC family transcriptional regulator [Conexivisphaerales archaeon]
MGVNMAKLDELDLKILQELVTDSSQSIPKLSKKIDVNTSVVYSRIKRLVRRGIIKRFTVEVDESQLGYTVSAYVGVNTDSKKRESVRAGIMGIPEVRELAEVTGRFDFLVFLRAKGLEELHNVISQKIGMIDGVEHTETFISMRQESKNPDIRIQVNS